MTAELTTLTADMIPYVTAAVGAYGGAVLAKVRDDAADMTVGIGRRLLQRIFGRKKESDPLPEILADLASSPDDPTVIGALQYTIRKIIENDAQMLADAREILAEANQATTVEQHVRAGRDAYVAGRDITVNRPAR